MNEQKPARLPSLKALRAFEAAGRHGSFTLAAEEQSVTPAAVAQQVKNLETYLGTKLFLRGNRSLELTDAGRTLLPGLTEGFTRVTAAVERLRRHLDERPLVVSIVPAFGGKWLLKRLDRFSEQHPDIDIRIDVSERVVDFQSQAVDIAVRYGDGDYPGLRVDRLLPEEVYPVCSPKLLKGPYPLREPADLQYHPLIDHGWSPRFPTWPDWEMWLKAAGLEDLPVHYAWHLNPSSASETLVLEEAIAGRGVALASSVLAADDLAAGRLVRPFEGSLPVHFAYWLVSPEETADMPKIRTFREWLLSEVENHQARMV